MINILATSVLAAALLVPTSAGTTDPVVEESPVPAATAAASATTDPAVEESPTPAATETPVAQQEPSPAANHLTIDIVTLYGSGCPTGTGAVTVAPDDSFFAMSYSSYVASTGPGVASTEIRKNCQVNIALHRPLGMTFAITQVDHHGVLSLGAGAQAVERSTHYSCGMSAMATVSHTFTGPREGAWESSESIDPAAMVFSMCSGQTSHLNLNTEVRIMRGTSLATATHRISLTPADGTPSSVYHLVWRPCWSTMASGACA